MEKKQTKPTKTYKNPQKELSSFILAHQHTKNATKNGNSNEICK